MNKYCLLLLFESPSRVTAVKGKGVMRKNNIVMVLLSFPLPAGLAHADAQTSLLHTVNPLVERCKKRRKRVVTTGARTCQEGRSFQSSLSQKASRR